MTAFIAIAGLLTVGVLLHVLRPLALRRTAQAVSRDGANVAIYRDQLTELEADLRSGTIASQHYETARQEIEKRLLEDVDDAAASGAPAAPPGRSTLVAAVAVAAAIPLTALLIYATVGAPAAVIPGGMARQAETHEVTPQQIQGMVDRLAERLKTDPENVEGWAMLGRSQAALGRFAEATAAFAEAARRTPGDAQLLADYADALGMAQGRTLDGEPEKLIERALKADPSNAKALALAGTVAFQRKDYAGAAALWERLLAAGPSDPEFTESIRANIAEARELGGKGAKTVKNTPATPPPAKGAPASVRGVARLSPQLAGKVSPTDTVFIYARAAEGSRMPLAILRRQVRDLPVSFVLDDSMAMNPQAKLSGASSIIVTARVSKSAEAATRPGDLQGQSAPVKAGASGVNVLIDSEVR